jgi:hypothetical protein
MAVAPIVRASNMLKLFQSYQKKNKVDDVFNWNNAKWAMHDMMEQFAEDDDPDLIEHLIEFYFLLSDVKTWQDFLWNYHDYLARFKEYQIAWKQRAYLQAETMKGKKNIEL